MIRLVAITIALTLALTASTALTDALVARCWWPGMAGACDGDGFGAPR